MKNDKKLYPPKLFHMFWIGGLIPEKYLKSVVYMAYRAKGSGFSLNLWCDKPVHFYKAFYSSIYSENNELLNSIVIRTISELENNIINVGFLDSKEKEQFIEFTRKEAIGAHNQALRVDLYRCLALFLEGGYYLDVDINSYNSNKRELKNNKQELLKEDECKYGFKIKSDNNSFIASLPGHEILKKTIKLALNTYKEYSYILDLFDFEMFTQEIELLKNYFDGYEFLTEKYVKHLWVYINLSIPNNVRDKIMLNKLDIIEKIKNIDDKNIDIDYFINNIDNFTNNSNEKNHISNGVLPIYIYRNRIGKVLFHVSKHIEFKQTVLDRMRTDIVPINNDLFCYHMGNRKDGTIKCTGPDNIHSQVEKFMKDNNMSGLKKEENPLYLEGDRFSCVFAGLNLTDCCDGTWYKSKFEKEQQVKKKKKIFYSFDSSELDKLYSNSTSLLFNHEKIKFNNI